jgi:hypothetical protein
MQTLSAPQSFFKALSFEQRAEWCIYSATEILQEKGMTTEQFAIFWKTDHFAKMVADLMQEMLKFDTTQSK